MFFTAGLVINEGINFILKHLIQQSRPENSECMMSSLYLCLCYAIDIHPRHLFGKYGMPSSHAQFVGCFATYFSLFVFVRCSVCLCVCVCVCVRACTLWFFKHSQGPSVNWGV